MLSLNFSSLPCVPMHSPVGRYSLSPSYGSPSSGATPAVGGLAHYRDALAKATGVAPASPTRGKSTIDVETDLVLDYGHAQPHPISACAATSAVPQKTLDVVREVDERRSRLLRNALRAGDADVNEALREQQQGPICTFPVLRSFDQAIETTETALDDIVEGMSCERRMCWVVLV